MNQVESIATLQISSKETKEVKTMISWEVCIIGISWGDMTHQIEPNDVIRCHWKAQLGTAWAGTGMRAKKSKEWGFYCN